MSCPGFTNEFFLRTMSEPIHIPVHADEPPRFLLWSADEVIPLFICIGFGIMIRQMIICGVLGLVITRFYKKFRDNHADGFMLHWLYWHGCAFGRSRSLKINPFIRRFFP